MHRDIVQRILGVLLMVFSITMVVPVVLSLVTGDGTADAFAITLAVLLAAGVALWLPVRSTRRELRTRDGFFVVAMFWVSLSLAGALPLVLISEPQISAVDAIFESVSGLTTTGATVIVGIDALPPALQYYRQQLQWLGGMGIVVLAVAILPMLGIGGLQLYRAEVPGPVKDAKLTPRLAETAKALWTIYVGLTAACALAYWLAGMTAFDAIGHAFSTLSTGGYSTHDASMGYFDSVLIEMIAVVFMFFSAVNFALHFLVWRRRSIAPWRADPEFRFYLSAVLIACGLVVAGLFWYEYAYGLEDVATWHDGVFQVVSFTTTTGYTTAEHASWPAFLPVLLVLLSFMGGSASSTSGGLKVIRCLLLFKQGWRELIRLIHPQSVLPIKIGERAVNERVIDSVWGFFATYVALFALIMLGMMALGVDQVTAFSATASGFNNLGPGLGEVGSTFATVGAGPKLLTCLAMILGRLEIFTLLVLFTPAFWRR